MPRAIPLLVRQALWSAAAQGASTAELADRFDLPARSIRHLLRLARTVGHPVAPAYRSGPRLRPDSSVFDAALLLKEEHPDWGARFIRGVLADSHPEDALPNERTIRRWLHRPDLAPAPPGKRSSRLPRATRPHQRWQVDAADQMHLLDGSPLSWLKAVDECSGAVLGTVLFPPGAVQPGVGPGGPGGLA